MPESSLRRIVEYPKHWISLLPRSNLPPTLVPLAYNKLGKMLREVKDLPLQVVGVNCASSYFRDTEVSVFEVYIYF